MLLGNFSSLLSRLLSVPCFPPLLSYYTPAVYVVFIIASYSYNSVVFSLGHLLFSIVLFPHLELRFSRWEIMIHQARQGLECLSMDARSGWVLPGKGKSRGAWPGVALYSSSVRFLYSLPNILSTLVWVPFLSWVFISISEDFQDDASFPRTFIVCS